MYYECILPDTYGKVSALCVEIYSYAMFNNNQRWILSTKRSVSGIKARSHSGRITIHD